MTPALAGSNPAGPATKNARTSVKTFVPEAEFHARFFVGAKRQWRLLCTDRSGTEKRTGTFFSGFCFAGTFLCAAKTKDDKDKRNKKDKGDGQMIQKHCYECGAELIEKELEEEGMVPFCPNCQQYRFPMYNVAVSMIVVDEETGKILLIQQYGKPSYILVAGYVNRGEQEEHAVVREVKEETGLDVTRIRFNRTSFFEPSNTLMCNFTAFVKTAKALHINHEIDRCKWFTPDEARANIRPNSLAAEFLNKYLDEVRTER